MPWVCTMPSQAYRAESVLVFGGPAIAAPPMPTAPTTMRITAALSGVRRSTRYAPPNATQSVAVYAMSGPPVAEL
jgi:hypothetical protein